MPNRPIWSRYHWAFWPSLKVTLPLASAPGRVTVSTDTFTPAASEPSAGGGGTAGAAGAAGAPSAGTASGFRTGSGSFGITFRSSTSNRTSM